MPLHTLLSSTMYLLSHFRIFGSKFSALNSFPIFILTLVLLLFSLPGRSSAQQAPQLLGWTVIAGGGSYTDSGGNRWNADQPYNPGSWGYVGGSTGGTTEPIVNTNDDLLYQSERYGNFSYKFDVPNGLYNVALLFAEIYWETPGERIFDVFIEGSRVLDRYDICAAVGCNTALALSFPGVRVQDGQLNIDFVTVKDNAKVSAISITSSDITPVVSLTSPTAGTTFSPGQVVTATGSGQNLRWDIDRSPDGLPSFAIGQGNSITFTVPANSNASQFIRITLTGHGGSATRDYTIVAPPPLPPAVSLTSPAAGTTFSPGQAVIATGSGQNLRWDIDRSPDGLPSFVTGQGNSITFTVPANSNASQFIRITLTGSGGTAMRDYNIVVPPPTPPTASVRKYDIFERSVTNANSYTNKFDFNVIELRTSFTSPSGKTYSFFGFHDGDGQGGQNGNIWKFRFMPDETGTWTYSWSWTDGTPGGSGSLTTFDDGLLPGPLRVASDRSWYFENSRGQPFHFRGYDLHNFFYWMPTAEMRNEIGNFKGVLQDSINKGYNFYMWDMMADRLNTSAQYDRDVADSGWLNTTDTKRFNIPVWYAYEDALRLTKDNGAYVITFAGMIWQGAQYNFTDFRVFLRYFVARFAPFYNFLGWSPTWETTDIWSAGETNQIMQYVHDLDPWKRPLTVHDCSNSQYTGWLSFSMRQAAANGSRDVFDGNHRRRGAQQGDCDGAGGIGDPFVNNPIVASEDIWESPIADQFPGWNMPRNGTETRRMAWGIQMAGAMPLYSEWNAWGPAGNGQGEPEVRRMFNFFYSRTSYRQYQQLNSLVSSSARQIASGIPGQEYLVYDENGGSITINLSAAPSSSTFSVLWYDPKSGAEQSGGSINGGASRTLNAPFSGDSVLFLSR
jgi:hypothetical protein